VGSGGVGDDAAGGDGPPLDGTPDFPPRADRPLRKLPELPVVVVVVAAVEGEEEEEEEVVLPGTYFVEEIAEKEGKVHINN